jgi:hypothetical protein
MKKSPQIHIFKMEQILVEINCKNYKDELIWQWKVNEVKGLTLSLVKYPLVKYP